MMLQQSQEMVCHLYGSLASCQLMTPQVKLQIYPKYLSAQSYNEDLETWEPIIEPWAFDVMVNPAYQLFCDC